MLKDTTRHGLCDRVWPPHIIERRGGGGGCEQGGWRGGEARKEEWTGGATTPHPSMLRLIRIATVLAAARPTLTSVDYIKQRNTYTRLLRGRRVHMCVCQREGRGIGHGGSYG